MEKSLFDLKPGDYQEINRLANLLFTPREVAVMLELDPDWFCTVCEMPDNSVYQSFHSGRLQAEVDLRTNILKLAKSGSAPAQVMAIDLLNKSKQKMIER